jgi:DNA-binding GntR family transcriptional regulator
MTELSSGDGRPRYRKLADLLRKRIVSGRYAVGSLLPTELEICQQHAVSRTTAREALRSLTVEGLVSRRAGHGTRVESASPVTRYSQAGSSIDGLLSERIRLWPFGADDVIADSAAAKSLRCRPGQLFLRMQGVVRRAKDSAKAIPLYWADIFVAAAYSDIRDSVKSHDGTIANLVEKKFGERVSAIHQEITPVLLDKVLARHLSARAGSPALYVKRWYYISDRFPAVVSMTTRPADRFTYTSQLLR